MKTKRILYEIIIFLLICLSFKNALAQEQLLIYQNGLYCKVNIKKQSLKNDTFILALKAEWLNEKLAPVVNMNDYVVLFPENITYESKLDLTLPDFTDREFVFFNDNYLLKILVSKSEQHEKIDFRFDFDLAKKAEVDKLNIDKEQFALKKPESVSVSCQIDARSKPIEQDDNEKMAIRILSPKPLPGDKLEVDQSKIEIIGKAYHPSGVNSVIVDSETAELVADGIFKKEIKLQPGYNDLNISIINNDGGIEKKTYVINCSDFSLAKDIIKAGRYYALIIAINDYKDEEINDLDYAIEDAENLYTTLLTYYTFEKENTTILKNPTREELIIELDNLSQKVTANDNLLMFFAGHGFWSERTEQGYWLPSDARKTNTANWIRNSTIRDYIAAIDSKHTLLIADACFSGGIFKTRSAFSNNAIAVEKLYNLPSRKAMTSGTINEVPDRSVFIKYLLKRMEENNEPYLPSETLFTNLKTAVINNSDNIPQFGEINNTGDEGGDFIFIRKK